jgi:lipopolysaccharide/colanic/teichoic acid biosynthesis glycosyltransferase
MPELTFAPTTVLKRAFDMIVAGAGLVASAPLWVLIAAAIKLEDGGPVFFTQARVGRGGVPFTAYKFRSMIAAAEFAPPRQATAGDPRITRVGAVLRPTAMDELPQLWNIFRGDMSFVGPRPLVPGEIEVRGNGHHVALAAIPGYEDRHAVTPGLTGLAQVYAPRDVRRAAKFRLDRLYAQRASFWLDLKLIAVSFWISACGRWEQRSPKL